MKKMALLLVMVFVLGGLMVQPGMAQAWYKCNILGAGVANGGLIQLFITDTAGAFTNIAVYEPNTDADANRNLAVALTAYSIGASAWVFTNGQAGGTFAQIVLSN